MSDAALRELERRYRESGARADQERYRQELLRSGRLEQQAEALHAATDERCGLVTLELAPAQGPPPACLNAIARQAEFRVPGAWHELNPQRAREILAALLHRDMAYRSETLPLAEAERITAGFFDLFGEPLRCFSTSDWEPEATGGPLQMSHWNPITSSTFDSGVVVTDGVVVGIFWFEDED
jgi:hypothetical protein